MMKDLLRFHVICIILTHSDQRDPNVLTTGNIKKEKNTTEHHIFITLFILSFYSNLRRKYRINGFVPMSFGGVCVDQYEVASLLAIA